MSEAEKLAAHLLGEDEEESFWVSDGSDGIHAKVVPRKESLADKYAQSNQLRAPDKQLSVDEYLYQKFPVGTPGRWRKITQERVSILHGLIRSMDSGSIVQRKRSDGVLTYTTVASNVSKL